MFTNKENQLENKVIDSNNIIGKGTTFKGNVETHGNIRIEGKVIGDINTKSKIVVGASAIIEGNIVAKVAEVEGNVNGTITTTDMLILRPTSHVTGDIQTNKFNVESGAKFDGKCRMGQVSAESANFNSDKKLQKAS